MTNLTEDATWIDGIYQIETTDPVIGGPPNIATKSGVPNIAAQQLANRTAWLKEQLNLSTPRFTRIFDDANPLVAYPGGTSHADAVVTHEVSYLSAFPGLTSTLYISWSSLLRLYTPDLPRARARAFLTNAAGSIISNEEYVYDSGPATGSVWIWGNVGGFLSYNRTAAEASVTLQQRCLMDTASAGSGATASIDKLELLIVEVARDG
ncbi:hypothetical protein [Palleronia caenipelagi]|uniref:Uncharacterized protein n=1 Tax=Palleronia caenipelagi TaxID=2489174 RepID=A0A547PW70_9RHOB|nr:hypothetical protein [Palleronia caenipelagi]TRD18397.1 hypothetical protein FEV53_12125 [Palleronia caenipelagi]